MLIRHDAETKDVDITLQYAGGSHTQMKYWLNKKMQGIPCYYRPQKGNNLSEVLGSAISDSFGRGHQYVVAIGKLYCTFLSKPWASTYDFATCCIFIKSLFRQESIATASNPAPSS